MAYLKFKADYLFTGTDLLASNYVLITHENGQIVEIVAVEEAGEDVQIHQGIISPGFINCHCHLELSHMKGLIPEKTGLVNFILQILQQRHFPDEAILQAIKDGETNMRKNGIVAVGDICNNSLTLTQKLENQLYYHNFIEVSGFSPAIAAARFQNAQKVLASFAKYFPQQCSMVPHAPYSVSGVLFEMVNATSGKTISSMHNQECWDENEFFETGNGSFNNLYNTLQINTSQFHQPTSKSSLRSVAPNIAAPTRLLLVHNTCTAQVDIDFLAEQTQLTGQQYVFCVCPNANLYIENQLPPIELLRSNQLPIVLGTDSLASNHSLSILDEMKTIAKHFPEIATAELLHWATLQGANALGISAQFGSFEAGKKPGIILINHLTVTGKLSQKSEVAVLINSNPSEKTNN